MKSLELQRFTKYGQGKKCFPVKCIVIFPPRIQYSVCRYQLLCVTDYTAVLQDTLKINRTTIKSFGEPHFYNKDIPCLHFPKSKVPKKYSKRLCLLWTGWQEKMNNNWPTFFSFPFCNWLSHWPCLEQKSIVSDWGWSHIVLPVQVTSHLWPRDLWNQKKRKLDNPSNLLNIYCTEGTEGFVITVALA